MTIPIATINIPLNSRRYLLTNAINTKTRGKDLGHSHCLSPALKRQILERDNYICQLCGNKGSQIDHIIPWRLSHDNSPKNLRAICQQCNIKRRLKRRDARLSLDEWFRAIENELERGVK